MKRISIRRKKKDSVPQPKPAPEPEPQDEYSESTSTSSESMVESEPPTKAFANLKVRENPERRPQVRFEPQVQKQGGARVVEPPSKFVGIRRNQGDVPRGQPKYLGQPRSRPYDNPSQRRSGKRNLQYASPYGPNGYNLSTQERARLLYFSCFG